MLPLNSRVSYPGKLDADGNQLQPRTGTLRGWYGPTKWPLVQFDCSPALTTIVAPCSVTEIPRVTVDDSERYCVPVRY